MLRKGSAVTSALKKTSSTHSTNRLLHLDAYSMRPYQDEMAKPSTKVLFTAGTDFLGGKIARQGGKNELSAQLELLLLSVSAAERKNLIKCSPTFNPQR